jgi:hypothetical protein
VHLQRTGVEADRAVHHLPVQSDLEGLEDDQAEQAEGDGEHGQQRAAYVSAHVAQGHAGDGKGR